MTVCGGGALLAQVAQALVLCHRPHEPAHGVLDPQTYPTGVFSTPPLFGLCSSHLSLVRRAQRGEEFFPESSVGSSVFRSAFGPHLRISALCDEISLFSGLVSWPERDSTGIEIHVPTVA